MQYNIKAKSELGPIPHKLHISFFWSPPLSAGLQGFCLSESALLKESLGLLTVSHRSAAQTLKTEILDAKTSLRALAIKIQSPMDMGPCPDLIWISERLLNTLDVLIQAQ